VSDKRDEIADLLARLRVAVQRDYGRDAVRVKIYLYGDERNPICLPCPYTKPTDGGRP